MIHNKLGRTHHQQKRTEIPAKNFQVMTFFLMLFASLSSLSTHSVIMLVLAVIRAFLCFGGRSHKELSYVHYMVLRIAATMHIWSIQLYQINQPHVPRRHHCFPLSPRFHHHKHPSLYDLHIDQYPTAYMSLSQPIITSIKKSSSIKYMLLGQQ